MADMVDFSMQFMTALVNFLATPPVFYLFGLICFCFICKAIKIIVS